VARRKPGAWSARPGSGKSTCSICLLRLLRSSSTGTYNLRDVIFGNWIPTDLRRCFALVSAESALILLGQGRRTNIPAYGSGREADMQAVISAAKPPMRTSSINAIRKGYDTPLGDAGLGLSGPKPALAIAGPADRCTILAGWIEATSGTGCTK